jgi:UDP-N-acetylmuramoyl-L-alanyl-D-glutamate--2,6-diaminopimelate ligase
MTSLREILSLYIKISDTNLESINLQWNYKTSDKNSILFLKETKNFTNEKIQEVIEKNSYKIIITNSNIESRNVFCLSLEKWGDLQGKLINYLYPLKDKVSIAITGTNGKSTTTFLIYQLLMIKEIKVILFGTNGVFLNGEKVEDFNMTTPHCFQFFKALHDYQDQYDFIVFEYSSHALEQNRLLNYKIDAFGWTNFTQDHLDYHESMDNYFNAKMKIKESLKERAFGRYSKLSLYEAKKLEMGSEYISQAKNFSLPHLPNFLKVKYNKDNLDLALSILEVFEIRYLEEEMNSLTPLEGRFNTFNYKNSLIIIDFAHTPDALENLLNGCRQSFNELKILSLFGCGGDRDKSKRPLMGEVAIRCSDHVIITSDNSRYEGPKDIIEDITKDLASSNFQICIDRKEAIIKALNFVGNENWVIVIAGKGHEPYLDVKGIKTPYSDIEYVMEKIND